MFFQSTSVIPAPFFESFWNPDTCFFGIPFKSQEFKRNLIETQGSLFLVFVKSSWIARVYNLLYRMLRFQTISGNSLFTRETLFAKSAVFLPGTHFFQFFFVYKITNCGISDKISGTTPFTRGTILTKCNIFPPVYSFQLVLAIKRKKGRFDTKFEKKSDIPKR